jgi:hypothetical protein
MKKHIETAFYKADDVPGMMLDIRELLRTKRQLCVMFHDDGVAELSTPILDRRDHTPPQPTEPPQQALLKAA